MASMPIPPILCIKAAILRAPSSQRQELAGGDSRERPAMAGVGKMTRADPTGRKDDAEKPRMDLLSPAAMLGTAVVLTFGARKYAANNWRKGIAWGRLTAALLRHTTAFMAGEDTDPESGLPHVDHIACCAMFLQEHFRLRKDLDDRWRP